VLVTITILMVKYPEKVIMVYGCKSDHCYLVVYDYMGYKTIQGNG